MDKRKAVGGTSRSPYHRKSEVLPVNIKPRIGLIPLLLMSGGIVLGQSAGGKIVPAFSIEPNVIRGGAESTISIAIANANPNSTQVFRAGDTYIITLNQPGISILRIDPVVMVRSMTLAPADFVAGYAVQNGQPSAHQLAIQYVGSDKVFEGGDSFGVILTVTAPPGAASSSAVFQLPVNDPDRFM